MWRIQMNHFGLNKSAKKRACNVSVNIELVQHAKSLGLNLSSILEEALLTQVKAKAIEGWKLENQSAIADYNNRIEKEGTFAEQESLL